jgi:hypothetical protein
MLVFIESNFMPLKRIGIPVLTVSPKELSNGFIESPVRGLMAYPPEVFKAAE